MKDVSAYNYSRDINDNVEDSFRKSVQWQAKKETG